MEVEEKQVPGSIGKSQIPVPANTVIELTGDTDLKPKLMATPYSTDLGPEGLSMTSSLMPKSRKNTLNRLAAIYQCDVSSGLAINNIA